MAKFILTLPNDFLVEVPFARWVYVSFIINFVVVVLVLVVIRWLPPQVPLFYGMAEGEGQLAKSLSLIIPNLFAAGILLVNVFLALKTKDAFIKKTLIVAGLAATFLGTITVIKIIFLVGSF